MLQPLEALRLVESRDETRLLLFDTGPQIVETAGLLDATADQVRRRLFKSRLMPLSLLNCQLLLRLEVALSGGYRLHESDV